ncbi:anhydro-N-acetylmuramic acid kinase [Cupriavidus respiraculi]|uniref:Anhydro-N-acetylmuramic acid kinase n=1 Tax=Cupriavidus respiraculi TaxID=195930 RepID=A0ABN7YMV9_9BURK|nr:anhydro-N-acetylmuramic acid kinase [Cupriavidus respiraculi]CAG9174743.1 Anhydro-N-acetylmuramic acid kinase [Cupriavidus respiraculi]
MSHASADRFVGLMSGTSMDGADGVLVDFSTGTPTVLAAVHQPFPAALREAFSALQQSGPDEIHREALAANELARVYADCTSAVLRAAGLPAEAVTAIGAHGQTIRHRPGLYDGIGYTRQSQHPALLAEMTGIDVVADFRSRDIAAGGQGAPLVPAFHQALFGDAGETRVVCNIGGISNISILPAAGQRPVTGFDCGPGNALLDHWIGTHRQLPFDGNGAWAASGTVDTALLGTLLAEPYFAAPPPKSTGRDLFHADWLVGHLGQQPRAPQDVQATLTALTAEAIARDVRTHAPDAARLIVCGGGAHNGHLMAHLQRALPGIAVQTSGDFGVPVSQVEAIAFAWLARQCVRREPGNLPSVTGATGPRVLGAIYPA